MSRGALLPLAALAALVAALAGAAPAPAARSVPFGFYGVMADGPLLGPATDLAAEMDRMVAAGVESVRVVVYWADAQPYATAAEVPADERARFRDAGGVPTDLGPLDRVVTAAAARGLRVLPVVMRAPRWARADPSLIASPPRADAPYTRFLTALIERYGPRGSLWAERAEVPRRPLRDWQVWNEPNIDRYWSSPQPFARRYARLLRSSRQAIRAADPGARVVMAGFANESWRALAAAYRAGVRGMFDVAAVHPFSGRLANVMKIVRLNREVMARNGDRRRPIWLTELTWPAAKGRVPREYGFETTEQGQAVRLRNAFRLLTRERRRLRIERISWYTWLSPDEGSPNAFDWSGLRRLSPGGAVDRPALAAYREVALPNEGCAAKAAVATRCG